MKFVPKCHRISSPIDELGCWCLQYKVGGAGQCSSIREEIVSMVTQQATPNRNPQAEPLTDQY